MDYLIKIDSVSFNGTDYLIRLLDKDRGSIHLYVYSLDHREFGPVDYQCVKDAINSDGCTGVADFYLNGCIVHDFHYRTHKDFDGTKITRGEADKRFRQYIQSRSLFSIFSPMSWWRWAAVRLLAARSWDRKEW